MYPPPAYSATTTFTDRATWEAAVTGIIQTEDFNSITPFSFPANGTTPVGLISVETVNNTNSRTKVLAGTDSLNLNGSTFVQIFTDGDPVITATIIFPELVTAWGMDWGEYTVDDTQITFGADISNESLFNLTGAYGGFVGFVSDTEFTQVEFSDPFISWARIVFDDLSFAAVPIITQPPSLNPGEQYRLAFVTSSVRDATSTDIADYNTFVTNAANTVPERAALNSEWFVIGSTSTVSAKVNTGTNVSPGLPIFLLDGSKLVDDYGDLWDYNIDVPLNRTEIATALTGRVFSGTQNLGNIDGMPLGNSPNVTYGRADLADNQWIRRQNQSASNTKHFYALSAPLTVVPEPASLSVLVPLLGGLALLRRGRSARS